MFQKQMNKHRKEENAHLYTSPVSVSNRRFPSPALREIGVLLLESRQYGFGVKMFLHTKKKGGGREDSDGER